MLRNNSDMPKTLKNKMVSGNPRPYSNVKTQICVTRPQCVKIKTYKGTNVPIVLCGCKISSLSNLW